MYKVGERIKSEDLEWKQVKKKLRVRNDVLYEIPVTSGQNQKPNFSMMGVKFVKNDLLLMRPYLTSKTFKNLKEDRCCVLNLSENLKFYFVAALKISFPSLEIKFQDGTSVPTKRLTNSSSWIECEVESQKIQGARAEFHLRPKYVELSPIPPRLYSRADFAIVEMLILASRMEIVGGIQNKDQIKRRIEQNKEIVKRTSGNKLHKELLDAISLFLESKTNLEG